MKLVAAASGTLVATLALVLEFNPDVLVSLANHYQTLRPADVVLLDALLFLFLLSYAVRHYSTDPG